MIHINIIAMHPIYPNAILQKKKNNDIKENTLGKCAFK